MNTDPESPFDPTSFDPAGLYALVTGLGAQAKILMGLMENPLTRQTEAPNLQKARVVVSTLEMLQEKTRGNLDEQEEAYLRAILTDLRMRWVELSGSSGS